MVYMVLRQLKVISLKMEIAPVFPVIGQCFLCCLVAAMSSLVLSWLKLDHLVINLVLYLLILISLFVWVKPFNDEQRQLVINIYPKLDSWSRWFFRSPGD